MGALLEFARARFELSRPDKETGKTRLQVLEDIRRQTGVVAPELADAPQLPAAGMYLWQWFQDLCRSRPQGFNSVLPLAWSEVDSYFRLIGVRPRPWEVEILYALDVLFVDVMNDDRKRVTSARAMKRG